MAISDTITSMYENVGNVYDVLELAGADLTNVDKNILNLKQSWEERLLYFLANGTDTLWNNWLPKVTGSGETITLNNTIEAKMDFVYKGNTSQNGTPTPDNPIPVQVVSGDNTIKVEGKNLFDTATIEQGGFNYHTGENFTSNEIIRNTIYNIKPNTQYTISCNKALGECAFCCFDKNGNSLDGNVTQTTNNNYTFTTNSSTSYIKIRIGNSLYPKVISDSYDIQLEQNSTATTYEPYVSQTYPINLGNIELCKIGTYQDKIAKSTGKNLFDISTITENTYITQNGDTGSSQVSNISDYIMVNPNTNYTLSYDYSTLLSTNPRAIVYYDENKNYISGLAYSPVNKTNTITTSNNVKYIRINLDKNCNNIMLNEGTTALPYEPYGKVWYLNKQIGKVVLDGSENWSLQSINSYGIANFQKAIAQYIGTTDNISLVNYFSPQTSPISGETQEGYRLNTSKTFYVRIKSNTASTVENFKTWLTTHNTIVYYVLATPTYTEITDTTLISQLEAIKKSYNTQTSISQVNNDLPFELDVVALGKLS